MKTAIPTISAIYIITLLITQASAINVTQGVIFETHTSSTQYYMNNNFTFTNITVTPQSLVLDSGNITSYPESGTLNFSLNRKENLNFTINATAENITIQNGFAGYTLAGSANYLLIDGLSGSTVNRSTATTDNLFFEHIPEGSYTIIIEPAPTTDPPSSGSSSGSSSTSSPTVTLLPSTNTTNTTASENRTTEDISDYQDNTTSNHTDETNELKKLAEEKIKHLREIITTDNTDNTIAMKLLKDAEMFFREGNYKKSIEYADKAEKALEETIEEPANTEANTHSTSNTKLIAAITTIIIIIAVATILKRKDNH